MIDWNKPLQWSSGEIAHAGGIDIGPGVKTVTACYEWLKLSGDATVVVHSETGHVLGCEDDYPHIQNRELPHGEASN